MPTGRPSVFRLPAVLVVDTQYVVPQQGAPYYAIAVAPDADFPHPTILVTRDQAAYETALAAEGSDQRVAVTWTHGTRADGRRCQKVIALTVCQREQPTP